MPAEGRDASFTNDEVRASQDSSDALWQVFHLCSKYRKKFSVKNIFFHFKKWGCCQKAAQSDTEERQRKAHIGVN